MTKDRNPDAWIEWHGGVLPVQPTDRVEIAYREQGVPPTIACAGQLNWAHFNDKSDVVAYRMISPAAQNNSAKRETLAFAKQVDGDHYRGLQIQPIEYIHANGIPFAEGCVIKYVTRWRAKNGIADLEKAKHFLELLIELESRRPA